MTPNKYLRNRSAIYGIRNTINGKLYIGKTKCMYSRAAQYKYYFGKTSTQHLNPYLLAAMVKIGFDKFEMFPIEFCKTPNLSERELFWITKFNTLDRNSGYNLRYDSSSGMIAHPETRKKISDNLKQQWTSGIREGHSEKLKKSWKNATPQRRQEQSDWFIKYRTKFEYVIVYPSGKIEKCAYSRLKELGIGGVITNMWRTKKNFAKCKGFSISRKPIGDA